VSFYDFEFELVGVEKEHRRILIHERFQERFVVLVTTDAGWMNYRTLTVSAFEVATAQQAVIIGILGKNSIEFHFLTMKLSPTNSTNIESEYSGLSKISFKAG
jgi:hypothetical protein